jgi:ATP-dependent DNA helicase RecG
VLQEDNMTPESLRALIMGRETLNVEFKGEEKAPLSDHDLVETVVCLANRPNSQPGWLLVGVEDDGRVTGARARHETGRTDAARLTATISNRTRPSLMVSVQIVLLEDKEILVIEVPPSQSPVGTADGRYLRRAIPFSRDAVPPGRPWPA